MFRRKIYIVLFSVLAASVLVGAGFGAWYFDSSYIRLETKLGVKVEDKVLTFGYLETNLPSDTVLRIDQGGFANREDLTKKICLYSASTSINNGIINSFNVSYFIKKTDATALAFDYTLANLTCAPTLNERVATYISLLNNAFVINDNECVFNLDGSGATTETIYSVEYFKFTKTMYVPASDEANPSFIYKEGQKPTTKEQHEAMRSDLSTVTEAITLNFSLTYKKGS